MKCAKCPLYHSWNNECDRGESCGLFGDGWDSGLQYEDVTGVIGCYVDRHYIEKVDKWHTDYIKQEVDSFEQALDAWGRMEDNDEHTKPDRDT